jgi:hypothetical protein
MDINGKYFAFMKNGTYLPLMAYRNTKSRAETGQERMSAIGRL